jgi:hypothetical protein
MTIKSKKLNPITNTFYEVEPTNETIELVKNLSKDTINLNSACVFYKRINPNSHEDIKLISVNKQWAETEYCTNTRDHTFNDVNMYNRIKTIDCNIVIKSLVKYSKPSIIQRLKCFITFIKWRIKNYKLSSMAYKFQKLAGIIN